MNKTSLYIVATPIGNLGDFTARAIETLNAVDVVLCEDTRVTGVLLNHFNIKTKAKSYHQHSSEKETLEVLNLLKNGKSLALVTDAGTPGISDPGNILVERVAKELPNVTITPIPGASAIVTALSISGFPTDKFLFLGFPPQKKGRKAYFTEVAEAKYTVGFYESNHRIEKTIKELTEAAGEEREVIVARELTKQFETIYRGTLGAIGAMPIKTKGEFVVIVRKA